MRNYEEIGRELERRGKADEIKRIAQSADGQRLSQMIDPTEIEQAAKNGDSAALQSMLSRVLSTDEGKRLAESVKKMMQS